MEASAGWVLYWMERLDEDYEYLQPTIPWITQTPTGNMRGDQLLRLRAGRKDAVLRR